MHTLIIKLIEYIADTGIQKQRIATKIGTNSDQLARWIHGTHSPSKANLIKIEAFLKSVK